MERNVHSLSSRSAQGQTCKKRCWPNCYFSQGLFAAGWQGWRNSSGCTVVIKAQDIDMWKFVPELRRRRQAFWWGKTLEDPEKRGWHKVGLILCFLLTAMFWSAQILLLKSADIHHAFYGLAMMDISFTTYSSTIHAGTTLGHFYYTVCKSVGQLAFLYLMLSNIG